MPRPIYLDDHATTRCDPAVVAAMLPFFSEQYGNPGSRTHAFGHQARAAVEAARVEVAAAIGGDPREIVFTSGATEADNLCLLGVPARHVVVGAIEHKAVLDPARALQTRGVAVTFVRPGRDGVVQVDDLVAALRPETGLVSLMLANNEVGTLQPVAALARECRARGIVLHTDAAQALGKIPIDVATLGVDLLSLSAHKAYGPKGVGALWVRRGRPKVPLGPLMFGGGQERGLRPGTLPVPLVVGFGAAARLARMALDQGFAASVGARRDRLLLRLRDGIPGLRVNGSIQHRLPNNLHVSIPGVDAAALLRAAWPIALSAGSACTSDALAPSHVLAAMGLSADEVATSFRIGLGRFTTDEDVDEASTRLVEATAAVRALSARME